MKKLNTGIFIFGVVEVLDFAGPFSNAKSSNDLRRSDTISAKGNCYWAVNC